MTLKHDFLCGFIADYVGVNSVVDQRVVPPPPPSLDKRSQEEGEQKPAIASIAAADYLKNNIVPRIKLDDIRLFDALNALLRPLDLGFRVMHDYIWITTPEKLQTEFFVPNDEELDLTLRGNFVDADTGEAWAYFRVVAPSSGSAREQVPR